MPAESLRPPPDGPADEVGLAKGATIGRYVVLGLLGRGGMGEVYAAYDPELDRKIAVKLLRARGGGAESDADGRTRLLREAQAIARLSHPNVVVVYDVGTFKESVFIAMEFVEGNTLGYWLLAETRRWREVLDVYQAAGRGLVAAHAAGLVHRDFKPDNVMLTKSGQVRVMDFGLAREQNAADEPSFAGRQAIDAGARAAALAETFGAGVDPDATAKLGVGGAPGADVPTSSGRYLQMKLTQTGTILGTPAYMAPEQFAGMSGDARADQFAFCVALYEGLYGRRPFAGDNAVALMANVVAGTVTDPPPDSKVPGWIRKLLLRGLSTTPDDRFGSMTELLAALGHDPAVRRRRWLGATVGAIVVVAAAVGVQRFSAGQRAMCAGGPGRAATAWGPERRAAIERAFEASGNRSAAHVLASATALLDQYVARWTGMYGEACEATHVRGEQSAEVLDLRMGCLGERLSSVKALTDVFSHADASVVDNAVSAASAIPSLERCADVAMLRAVIKPPDDPNTRAQVAAAREELAKVNALRTSGQCDRAATAGRKLVAETTAIGYLPLQAEAHWALGLLGDFCTDFATTAVELDQAVFDAEASHHDEVAIQASASLGGMLAQQKHDVATSRLWLRRAESILARFPGHPLLDAWISVSKGFTFAAEGRYDDALTEQRRALALKEQVLGPSNLDRELSAMNVALALHDLDRDAEAAPVIAGTVDGMRRLLGNDSTQLALALLDQSEILTALRQFRPAHDAIEKALEIWKTRNASPFFIGYATLDLGRLQLAEGQERAARATLEQAVESLRPFDATTAAEADFALARALWPSSRERERSVHLARGSRAVLNQGSGAPRRIAEIDAWLTTHPL